MINYSRTGIPGSADTKASLDSWEVLESGDAALTLPELMAQLLQLASMLKSALRSPADDLQLVSEKEAAKILGITPKTLQNRRYLGQPPAYVKDGPKVVKYRLKDLEDHINFNTVRPCVQLKGAAVVGNH